MCGLVGIFSSNMTSKHKNILSAMLYLDTWRGRDSTGVAAIRHNSDTHVLKSTIPGYEFVEGPALDQHLKFNDFCWIGHNRAGTIGKNVKTNAHPFMVYDDEGLCTLVGAHNGTLKNKHALENHQQYGTDSEALFNSISNEGLEDTLPKIEGAWALSYYDHVEGELRFIRNKERTLYYAFEEGNKTLFWASEAWMIRVAVSRAGLKLANDNVFSFAEDTLYYMPEPEKLNEELSFKRKGGLVGKDPVFFPTNSWTKPHKEAEKASSPTKSGEKMTSTSQSGTTQQKDGEKQSEKKSPSSEKQSNVRNILSAKVFKGFGGTPLSKTELDDQLENGCAWCETEFIAPEDRFAWLAPSKPVCHKCLTGVEDEEVEEVVTIN